MTFTEQETRELCRVWLLDKRRELVRAATKTEQAYSRGPMFAVCQYAARAYWAASEQIAKAERELNAAYPSEYEAACKMEKTA